MNKLQAVAPPGTKVMGPYSPAVIAGDLVFVSGQIPRNDQGVLVADTIENATAVALEKLGQVLAAADCAPSDVVKTTVFLQDLNDFEGMNKTYAVFFGEHRPARSTVQVAKLPANSRIEIECVALRPKPKAKTKSKT